MKNKSARRYRRKVLNLLPCTRRQKQKIISQFDASLSDFIESNPDVDFVDLEDHFGSPEAIAASYVESAGTAEILSGLRIRRRIVTIVTGVMVVALLLWATAVTWTMVEFRKSGEGFAVIQIDELPPDTAVADGIDEVIINK